MRYFCFNPWMNKLSIKDIWLILNLCFIINYSISILKIFVAFPLLNLPPFFNSLFLFCAYALTLQTLFSQFSTKNISKFSKKIISHPNTFCLFVFLCFPPNLLLFPFYLLSLYHLASAVVARKEEFNKYFFYDLCVFIDKNLNTIGRTALFLEIFSVFIALVLLVIRRISLFTLLSYIFMIRQQYITNDTMKSVCMEIIVQINELFHKLPTNFRDRFSAVTGYIDRFTKSEGQKLTDQKMKKTQ